MRRWEAAATKLEAELGSSTREAQAKLVGLERQVSLPLTIFTHV